MIKKTMVLCLCAAVLAVTGQTASAKDKPVRERGWIGGTYDCARSGRSWSEWSFGADHTLYTFPPALAKSQGAGIFVASLGTNTPAYLAGMREGDLLLALNDQPVTSLPSFWQAVRGGPPGSPLVVKGWRNGQTVEFRVAVGREKYQALGCFTIGLPGFWEPFHPVPTREAPHFSLMALGYERPAGRPAEFASVADQYAHSCHPKGKQTGYDADWRLWLAIFEVKNGKQIIAQEIVPAKG